MNIVFNPALAQIAAPLPAQRPDSESGSDSDSDSGARPGEHPALLLAARLAVILVPLLRLINVSAAILGVLLLPLHARIARAQRRLERLLAGLAAGTAPRPHIPGSGRKGGPRGIYISRRRAWLIVQLGHHAAGYASQLQFLLNDPATLALLAAAPPSAQKSAGRTLRPLARLLGIDLPKLLHPALPQPARQQQPAPPAIPAAIPPAILRDPRPVRPAAPKLRHPIYPQRHPRVIYYPDPPRAKKSP